MNLLYIGLDIITSQCGQYHIDKRNQECLKALFGTGYKELILTTDFLIPGRAQRYFNTLKGYYYGDNKAFRALIDNELASRHYDYVFLSHSYYGKLCKHIKTHYPNTVILTFFHDIEVVWSVDFLKESRSFGAIYHVWISRMNEHLVCKYSDYVITLNSRDDRLLQKHLSRKADIYLPSSIQDTIGPRHIQVSRSTPLRLLFVGSNFWANEQGIRWFVANVMPHTNHVELYIVGNRMELLRDDLESTHVKVIGSVDSLQEWYLRCDAVVSPIFLGGGMKTKTVEAMMYSMPVIATPEAFEGYEIDYSRIGAICETDHQFIASINAFSADKSKLSECSRYAREMYETKYSYKSSIAALTALFQKINTKHA